MCITKDTVLTANVYHKDTVFDSKCVSLKIQFLTANMYHKDYLLLSHPIHRWPGTITLMIASPRTLLPHAPPSLLHPATPRSHLLRRGLHTLRTHSRRSHTALSLPSSNLSPARNRTSDPVARQALTCSSR